jgi:hypothetical protein
MVTYILSDTRRAYFQPFFTLSDTEEKERGDATLTD